MGKNQPLSGSISSESTWMFREAAEASEVVRRQRARNAEKISNLGQQLRAMKPRAVVTVARGSSDHAATFARYLIETRADVLTSSAAPSVSSIYGATPDLRGAVVLAFSQSGRSPDLLAAAKQASARGALLVSLVNDEDSPLVGLADVSIPLCAGPERSVAATKSFIASLVVTLDLLASWANDTAIDSALWSLPGKLSEAWNLDWSAALDQLCTTNAMYVVGRGHGLGIAQEAALKLKETCGIQAEAFSAAEVRHGPMAIVREGFPVFLFGQPDESRESVAELAAELESRGARLISTGVPSPPGTTLPGIDADPLISPILQISSFYRFANALALRRGLNPDRPLHLTKITETL